MIIKDDLVKSYFLITYASMQNLAQTSLQIGLLTVFQRIYFLVVLNESGV